MATHEIPRNLKGEGRILNIFSYKALIYTTVFAIFGLIFYYIFEIILGIKYLGIAINILFALIGFSIATFKVPETSAFEVTKKTGGQNIDDVIIRAIKFYTKKRRIYLYTKAKEIKEENEWN